MPPDTFRLTLFSCFKKCYNQDMLRYQDPDSTQKRPSEDRPERPLGVTILSIWNGISLGLLPIVLQSVALTSGARAEFTPLTCLTLLFSMGILFTALGTWRGHDPSRMGMLILLVVYHGFQSFNTSLPLFTEEVPAEARLQIYGQILRSVGWVIVNAWYFLRPSTIDFYRRRTG